MMVGEYFVNCGNRGVLSGLAYEAVQPEAERVIASCDCYGWVPRSICRRVVKVQRLSHKCSV